MGVQVFCTFSDILFLIISHHAVVQKLTIKSPEGEDMEVTIPAGKSSGDSFIVLVPWEEAEDASLGGSTEALGGPRILLSL